MHHQNTQNNYMDEFEVYSMISLKFCHIMKLMKMSLYFLYLQFLCQGHCDNKVLRNNWFLGDKWLGCRSLTDMEIWTRVEDYCLILKSNLSFLDDIETDSSE